MRCAGRYSASTERTLGAVIGTPVCAATFWRRSATRNRTSPDRKRKALRDFVKDIVDGSYDVHGIDARSALELLQRRARKLLSAIQKTPCGECHLKPGETCDICGAQAPAAQR